MPIWEKGKREQAETGKCALDFSERVDLVVSPWDCYAKSPNKMKSKSKKQL